MRGEIDDLELKWFIVKLQVSAGTVFKIKTSRITSLKGLQQHLAVSKLNRHSTWDFPWEGGRQLQMA